MTDGAAKKRPRRSFGQLLAIAAAVLMATIAVTAINRFRMERLETQIDRLAKRVDKMEAQSATLKLPILGDRLAEIEKRLNIEEP